MDDAQQSIQPIKTATMGTMLQMFLYPI